MSQTTSTPWLRCFHPADRDTPIVVALPHAGGAASYFFGLSAALAPEVEVHAVQYPGRQDRRAEAPCSTVAELAQGLTGPVAQLVGSGRPVVLFGHSLGATVGFEIVRRLEATESGHGPAAFVASARDAPSGHRSAGIHRLDDDGVVAELKRLSGTHDVLLDDEEMRALVLPAIRADYTAAETYRYVEGPPLRTPITVVCGDADPRVDPADVRGWEAHTSASYDLRVVAGDHFYFGEDPSELARILAEVCRSVTRR